MVAPISVAMASERTKGEEMAIGLAKDDMAVPFLDLAAKRKERYRRLGTAKP
jgi:hypothetical protein